MSADIYTARVLKTRGLHGEVKIECEDTKTKYRVQDILYTDSGRSLTVKQFRHQGAFAFLQFEEMTSLEEAQKIVGCDLYRREDTLPKPEKDHYYVKDLVGMTVLDENGMEVGKLEEVMTSYANDIYRVRKISGGELLIPAVKAFILEVDQAQQQIRVRLIEGM